VNHPPHGRIRGASAHRLKINSPSHSIRGCWSAVGHHHRGRGDTQDRSAATRHHPITYGSAVDRPILNYSGSWNGGLFTYNGTALTDGSRFTVGTQQWEIDYNASAGGLNFTGDYLPTSRFVVITAVPEPSTLVLAGLGTALAVMAARHRTRPRNRLASPAVGKRD